MAASALLSLLPPAWTRWASAILQPVAWLQHLAAAATRSAARHWDERSGAAEVLRLREENEALRRQLLHAAVLLDNLGQQLEAAAFLGGADRQIVPARVIAADARRGRSTLRLSRGRAAGIAVGDWVAAAGIETPDEPAAARLMRCWLIGQVSEAAPYVSTVRLLSDRGVSRVRVRLARPTAAGGWERSPVEALLYGLGDGRMEIREAPLDFVSEGFFAVLGPDLGQPPLALTVGRAVRSEPVPSAPLFHNIEVRAWQTPDAISTVYVLTQPEPAPAGR
ncbi:MAG: hypothetical protein H3C42_06565 [Phycisphaerae bacterium]|nr:hypothetical protein [Phycisphaerae bacterium]